MAKFLIRTGSIAAFIFLLAIAAPAQAQSQDKSFLNGFYFSLNGGGNFLTDSDIDDGSIIDSDAEFDPGFAVRAAVGRRIWDGLRVELEFNYASAEFDELVFAGLLSGAGEGDIRAFGAHANLIYDIKTGTRFIPYFGGGVGYSRISLDDITVLGVDFADGGDDTISFNITAGLNYAITERVAIGVNYRFFRLVGEADFVSEPAAGGLEFDAEYLAHQVFGGITFTF